MTILSTNDSNDKNKETLFRAGLRWGSDQNYDVNLVKKYLNTK